MSKQSTLLKHISGVKPLPDQQSTLNFQKKAKDDDKKQEEEVKEGEGDVEMVQVEDDEEGEST